MKIIGTFWQNDDTQDIVRVYQLHEDMVHYKFIKEPLVVYTTSLPLFTKFFTQFTPVEEGLMLLRETENNTKF